MKALITGGAGFIGSHLAEELLKKRYEVYVVDNLSTGNKKNLQVFMQNDNFTFIQGDVADPSVYRNIDNLEIGEIYHLASPASVTYIMDYPVEAADANSNGTRRLLEFARKKNAKILFIAHIVIMFNNCFANSFGCFSAGASRLAKRNRSCFKVYKF